MDPTGRGLQADKDAPVAPRQSSRTTGNQPLWLYWNFALEQKDILPDAFIIWVGLCICLHIISCMEGLHGEYSVRTLNFKPPQICPTHTNPGINGDTMHVNIVLDF